jgi:hypothetical protein
MINHKFVIIAMMIYESAYDLRVAQAFELWLTRPSPMIMYSHPVYPLALGELL